MEASEKNNQFLLNHNASAKNLKQNEKIEEKQDNRVSDVDIFEGSPPLSPVLGTVQDTVPKTPVLPPPPTPSPSPSPSTSPSPSSVSTPRSGRPKKNTTRC